MTNYELVRNKVIEAVPEIQGRNTSMILTGVFTGLINHKNEAIRLADVVQALWAGEFDNEHSLEKEQKLIHELCVRWNCKNDDLLEQSPETTKWLAEILK